MNRMKMSLVLVSFLVGSSALAKSATYTCRGTVAGDSANSTLEVISKTEIKVDGEKGELAPYEKNEDIGNSNVQDSSVRFKVVNSFNREGIAYYLAHGLLDGKDLNGTQMLSYGYGLSLKELDTKRDGEIVRYKCKQAKE